MTLTIRFANEADLPALLAIYNDAVENTLAIWNETLVDLENRREWLKARNRDGFPVLVAEREEQVVGYASYGPFRPFEGFRHSSELSVYVASDARGGGIGRALLAELVEEARERKVHVLVAGIEAGNTASIALHKSQGFEDSGTLKQVGQKFGRWLDLTFMQKIL
ncbi:N-acetyltransferase family protein [Brucella pseudogrignonensis]|jgi:phosphinothricin acetyltransferase|uniref:Acetyltransferase domain protein n=1 Tax=Brucella pseudogrignonensis TaxID=419475 RepID=A0A256GPE9_9HYPH|nr:GNAT family N-acetyltransferase [Brucella pseudogrignonensis]EMG53808.1 N-acetyltransferase GCN5 [Ochrobactrum sp. CDB2]MCM0751029.1 N-acetyltransferase [Brucella pseudogrignonensis]NKX15727.1 N-acetyltransferase [Brucella pseudogrignonensis]NNV22923.1 N-acetyltransferase [Brucella pseudogrignonensis]OYR28969.1 acetyltransferase domain protein [Brucella pseudogrignonensis]